MKTLTISALGALCIFATTLPLHSQGAAPKSPIQQLQEIKAKNALQIEKQTATLQKLEELAKQAEQLKFLAARS
jgi:hypothetical protein